MNFTAVLLSLVLAIPVAAQSRSDDSLAVNGLLSPQFIFIQRAEIRDLAAMQGEDGIVSLVRWHQQTARGPRTLHARFSPSMAYVWTSAEFSSKSRPDLFKGTEVELLVLTRRGQTWFIEAVHGSLKDRE